MRQGPRKDSTKAWSYRESFLTRLRLLRSASTTAITARSSLSMSPCFSNISMPIVALTSLRLASSSLRRSKKRLRPLTDKTLQTDVGVGKIKRIRIYPTSTLINSKTCKFSSISTIQLDRRSRCKPRAAAVVLSALSANGAERVRSCR